MKYSTVIVCCLTKEDARKFLTKIKSKQLEKWVNYHSQKPCGEGYNMGHKDNIYNTPDAHSDIDYYKRNGYKIISPSDYYKMIGLEETINDYLIY